MTQQLEVTLTFAGTTATITSNDAGMFDLNDVYRKFGIKGRRLPSDWRTKDKAHYVQTGNLWVEKGGRDKRGRPSTKTLGTETVLYAYAMWVDIEFYMVVVEAFAALTLGNTEEAQKITNSRVNLKQHTN